MCLCRRGTECLHSGTAIQCLADPLMIVLSQSSIAALRKEFNCMNVHTGLAKTGVV